MMPVSTHRAEPMRRHLALLNGMSECRLLHSRGGASASATHDAYVSRTPAARTLAASGPEGDARARCRRLRRLWEHSAIQSHGVYYY
jgi:hypothetical protein